MDKKQLSKYDKHMTKKKQSKPELTILNIFVLLLIVAFLFVLLHSWISQNPASTPSQHVSGTANYLLQPSILIKPHSNNIPQPQGGSGAHGY
jgi:hypothetical protein